MREIQLLLKRADGIGEQAFDDALGAALQALREQPALTRTELMMRMSTDALTELPHFAASEAAALAPDAILAIAGPEPAFVTALAKTQGRLRAFIDREASAFVTGRRYEVLPGTNTLRLFFALSRYPHMTREEFQDYWLNHHANIARRLIPPLSYHQFHASTDTAWTARVAELSGLHDAGFDGLVDCHYPDVETFVQQLSRPEVTGEALEDERRFIDHSRAVFWLYRYR